MIHAQKALQKKWPLVHVCILLLFIPAISATLIACWQEMRQCNNMLAEMHNTYKR